MGYIITAEADTTVEVNQCADRAKVKARVLSERNGYVTFDAPGDFNLEKQRAVVLELCRDLVDAGYVEFRISHSY
jgi:hypothetical protein